MKKFFTLCLAFMLASLLNVNAADTYTLVGDLNSWNTSAEGYNFTYVEATDSYVLEGVTLKGEFKIVKNNSWDNPAFGSNGNSVPLDAAYIMWNTDAGNMVMIDGKNAVYNDCKLELKVLSAKNASLRITSSTAMTASFDTRADVWCVAGTFSDSPWSDANEMTALGNGVYEFWSTELPSEFKFKAKGNWDISLGIHNEIKNTPIMGFDNAVDNGGANISLKADQTYDKYRYTLTVRGWVASFRVDGYKEAVPSLTRVFYESFDQNEGSGGNDGAWKDSVANGEWNKAVFDEPGWTASNGYYANKCIKLGASSKLGSATTPALGVTGNAELRFKAGAWNGDATTINITINNGGTLSASSVTIANNAFTDYTISISDATPESTITFSATKASKNRFFLDEVEVYANSSELSAAGITLTGVMKDANTAYYHHTLAYPTVNITLPAGATYMDVEIENSGWVNPDISPKNQTEDCSIQLYSAGNYTVRVTAYGEGAYSVASKDIAIETVSSVYTFDELINKGEGATCYLNFSPTVVAHVGKYLYLEGYDMWDGIRSSALVYASLDKTYKKGDVLQGFIATVAYYNGNPQLIPLNTSLGDPYSYSEPYVYEVEAGDAWEAFAVEANVNKYVRVKNAPVTADAVDGVAVYTKNLGVNMPEDLTKKYDVEGFINKFNGTIQILPLSFTAIEEKIEPFTYTEIVPANNTEVTSLSEIKITFPYEVAYDETVGVTVTNGDNTITPAVAVDGAVATLTFDAITTYGSKPSLMVGEGAFKEKVSNVGCQQITASWSIPTPPITYDFAPVKVTPASGSTVEKLERITLQVPEDVSDCRWAAQSYGNEFITVTDDKGNSYNGKLGYTSYTEYYYLYVENATASGTYTITVKEGVFGDEEYFKKFEKGHANPEFTLTYTIKAAALAAPTVDPANGAEIENPSTITLTFAEAVTVNAEAGELSMVNTSDAAYDFAKNFNVAISEDGLTATITCEPGYPNSAPRWAIGKTYKLNIPAGYFVAASGAASEALEYSWKVVPAPFTVASTTPEVGEVEKLDVIKVYFTENKVYTNIGYSWASLELVDNAGQVVTTGSVTKEGNWVGDVFKSNLVVTLAQPVTTPGQYTLVIPEGYARNVEWGDGAINAATNLTWTVKAAALAAPTVDPANGAEVENPSTVTLTFAEAVTVNAEAGELSMVNTSDAAYDFAKNFNVAISEDGLTATITCEPGYPSSAPRWAIGKIYKLNIPAGYFVAASGAASEALEYSWKVVPAKFTYVAVDPAQGDVAELSEILISFAKKTYGNGTLPTLNLVDADGNVVTTATTARAQNANGDWYAIKATLTNKVTTPGTYTLVVPADVFRDVEWGDGATNAAFDLTYTIKEVEVDNTVYDMTLVSAKPANGAEVESLETIKLTFNYDDSINLRFAANNTGWITVTDEAGNSYDAYMDDNWDGYVGDYIIYVYNATQPGTYTVTIPKGTVADDSYMNKQPYYLQGHANPEIVLTYTIKAEEVEAEDFTPVVNPAAGNVTAEQIKTTVLSFESPIASFDGSDVGLRHQFGGPWYDYAATGTISEDKLSMTIVWDFAPTVGTTYTLKLPAGCIVLENGAKNLETNVVYTVVAGPKDLAEFVVPAGYEGYVNYDETDINAWAPEFPFTVSTTAYNTVAFAAELPSLPAGITAMEVIDENGEVIAVLNQDGVAPLADGEIFYVKGETTKEYVEGTELKFRFRFTHLGISETILFSYKVAGGNITSIANVELDGNVIVRGNDIIAPQGAAIFTVSGIRVPAEGLAPGVYVVVLGNEAVKVMVK